MNVWLAVSSLGLLQEAVSTYTKCLSFRPFFLDGLIARGNVYMDYGHKAGKREARRDYERALRLDPMCMAARVNLAYSLQVTGKLMQAWRNFTIAITLKPSEQSKSTRVIVSRRHVTLELSCNAPMLLRRMRGLH